MKVDAGLLATNESRKVEATERRDNRCDMDLPMFVGIVELFGPVASFNVAGTLSPVISGYCMFLLARKFTDSRPAQIVGALLWGFSPLVLTSADDF